MSPECAQDRPADQVSGDVASRVFPRDSVTVRGALESLITRRLEETPKRGKGARRRQFMTHVAKVFKSYESGLFHCYDNPKIPQTSNELEGKNGANKHHIRKTNGRASTAGGTAETIGEFLFGALDTVRREGIRGLIDRAKTVGQQAYETARKKLRELREPARLYRSIQRDPQRYLDQVIAEWEADDG